MKVALREARPGDAGAIAPLLGQLGYPAEEAVVAARLAPFLADASRRVAVAERGGRLVGLAVGETSLALNRNGRVARLALLVVDEAARGGGVGRMLVRDFEAWAAARGARHASLTSATHRHAAHAFYRACGWEATGLRFARELGADAASEG